MESQKNNVTVVITAHNEAHVLEECIRSAQRLTSHIIYIDTESTDESASIAKKMGCTVEQFAYSRYVEPSREFALQQVKTDWAFILDADERISTELAQEIQKVTTKTEPAYFYVPRKNIFAGRTWLKHGGWYPDKVLRLIRKSAFKSWPKAIHSTPVIDGSQGSLNSQLEHYFHPNLENMVTKTAIFEDIESDLLFKAGRPVTTSTFFRKYLGELHRRLIKNAGYRDGTAGIIESFYQAFSKTSTYLMLYEKYEKKRTAH